MTETRDWQEAEDNKIEVWRGLAEAWRQDWGACMDYLVEHTDLEDRNQAMLYMITSNTQSWARGIQKNNQRAQNLMPRITDLLERIEDEMDQGEGWKE